MPRKKGAREFSANLARLEEAVGQGELTGRVEVNQVYAADQHNSAEYVHPFGGKAFYLTDPLMDGAEGFMQHLAERAITADGSELAAAMADNMEDLSAASSAQAPKWFGDLANSMAPSVVDDTTTSYERAPKARRLTEDELEIKSRHRHPSDFR